MGRYFVVDDTRDALRKIGGLLLGLGLLMVFLRKSTSFLGDTWSDGVLLLLLIVTFALLYGVGMLGRMNTLEPRPWQGVLIVFGIIVAPLVGFQFVDAVNGSPGAALNVFWILGVTAVLAAAATFLAGVRVGLLLAAIAVIISWSAFWDKVISGGLGEHTGWYRFLLLVIAAVLLGAAWVVSQGDGPEDRRRGDGLDGRRRGIDLVTGAAIAAVLAGSLSIAKLAQLSNPLLPVSGANSAVGWEIVLLVVSLAAVVYGSRVGARGPVYIGGIGLAFFLLIAGYDLNSSTPHGKIVGWPLLLVVLGLAALVAGLRPGPGAPGATAGTAAPGARPPAEPPAPPPQSPAA